jgi:UrcA family protein
MTKSVKSAGSAAVAFSITFGLIAVLAEQPAEARDLTVTAAIQRDVPSELVTAAGLDLASSKGSEILEARVRAASRRVCAVSPVSLTAATEMSCRRSARAAAAPQIANLVQQARALASAGQPASAAAAIVVSAPRS